MFKATELFSMSAPVRFATTKQIHEKLTEMEREGKRTSESEQLKETLRMLRHMNCAAN